MAKGREFGPADSDYSMPGRDEGQVLQSHIVVLQQTLEKLFVHPSTGLRTNGRMSKTLIIFR